MRDVTQSSRQLSQSSPQDIQSLLARTRNDEPRQIVELHLCDRRSLRKVVVQFARDPSPLLLLSRKQMARQRSQLSTRVPESLIGLLNLLLQPVSFLFLFALLLHTFRDVDKDVY